MDEGIGAVGTLVDNVHFVWKAGGEIDKEWL